MKSNISLDNLRQHLTDLQYEKYERNPSHIGWVINT